MLHGPATDPEELAFLQPIRDLIGREGYGQVIDADSEQRQEVCYSVGLTEKGLPELIAGMEDFTEFPQGTPSLMHHLIGTLLERGGSYGEGDVFEFHGQWVRLIPEPCTRRNATWPLGYTDQTFPCLQVVPCSANPNERKETHPICLN